MEKILSPGLQGHLYADLELHINLSNHPQMKAHLWESRNPEEKFQNTIEEKKNLKTNILKRVEKEFHFAHVTSTSRWQDLVPGRPPQPVSFPAGERESMWVSACLSQLCWMLPKRSTSFSPNSNYWGDLQGCAIGRGGEHRDTVVSLWCTWNISKGHN